MVDRAEKKKCTPRVFCLSVSALFSAFCNNDIHAVQDTVIRHHHGHISFLNSRRNQSQDPVQSPFRVVWNYPDQACQRRNINFELSKYGFVVNQPGTFIGNQIATLYDSKAGLWPSFKNREINAPSNGGIPQLGNMTAHLVKLRQDIAGLIPDGSTGYGVLNQELWRTLYDLNYGVYTVYKTASLNEVSRKNPKYTHHQRKGVAEMEWEKSAREFMEKSLKEAQQVRPKVHWGYYLHPQMWWTPKQTQWINDRMAWLYRASTGIYPSIYIKHAATDSPGHITWRLEGTLKEAIRVRAVYGQPDVPVAAYTMVQNHNMFFNESVLDLAIGLPAEMGIDGVIIWGSSYLFRPRAAVKCSSIKNYVNNVLGPYVSRLLKRVTNCSVTKCGGHGRCVRKDYAKTIPHILDTSSRKRRARAATTEATSLENREEVALRGEHSPEILTPHSLYQEQLFHEQTSFTGVNLDHEQTSTDWDTLPQPWQASLWNFFARLSPRTSYSSSAKLPLQQDYNNFIYTVAPSGSNSDVGDASPCYEHPESLACRGQSSQNNIQSVRVNAPSVPSNVDTPSQSLLRFLDFIAALRIGKRTEGQNNQTLATKVHHQITPAPQQKDQHPLGSPDLQAPPESRSRQRAQPGSPNAKTRPENLQGLNNNSWHAKTTQVPSAKDEYENYVCRCYSGWAGPSCRETI